MNIVRLAVFALLVHGAVAIAAHEGHDDSSPDRQYKVGKTAEISIREDTALLDFVLKKGRYTIVHDADGDQHWFTFSPVAKNGSRGEAVKPVEVKTACVFTRKNFAVRCLRCCRARP